MQALKRQRVQQMEERLKTGPAWHNEANLVFTDLQGGLLRRTNVQSRDLRRIIRHARLAYEEHLIRKKRARTEKEASQAVAKLLDGVTLHTFRHAHASLLIFAGADPKVVQRRLGHEDVRITLQKYGHLFDGQDERAAQMVDELISHP